MYGPGTGIFPRIASVDCFIKDLPISKGTVLTYHPTSNHYNEKYFKNPQAFRPERW
jgi:cytochrome P450